MAVPDRSCLGRSSSTSLSTPSPGTDRTRNPSESEYRGTADLPRGPRLEPPTRRAVETGANAGTPKPGAHHGLSSLMA